MRVDNCFDSHVHWLYTGQMLSALRLDALQGAPDVLRLQTQPWHYRGDWLTGFGWDHNLWSPSKLPTREVLDQAFGSAPVAFTRADGHAIWANSEALRRAGISQQTPNPRGGFIARDPAGVPTGVLIDLASQLVISQIPEFTPEQIRTFLVKAMRYFNQAGFTHIRDLSCSRLQWEQVIQLDQSGELTLAVEQYFDAENPDHFEQALQLASEARSIKLKNVRPMGVKVFFDGALGSEGAYLSCPYCSGSGRGLVLMSNERLKEIMRRTWERSLDLAVHVIGDEAVHQVALQAHELALQGIRGALHFEHAQMVRPETIELIKSLGIKCHMQPCHWLADRRWLHAKLGPLVQYVFPWRALEQAGVSIDFGSDSPIERPSLSRNLLALDEAVKHGIRPTDRSGVHYHSHHDPAWVKESYSLFCDGRPQAVYFGGSWISSAADIEPGSNHELAE